MKKHLPFISAAVLTAAVFILLIIIIATTGCRKDVAATPAVPVAPAETPSYQKTVLVADVAGYGAYRLDPTLLNPWGISVGSSGSFWISGNHSGATQVYDRNGLQLLPNIATPFNGVHNGASPTGTIYNSTAFFLSPVNGLKCKFIYSTEDGILTGWNTGDSTVTLADRSSAGAVYKGLALANDGTANFLYAADFYNAKIDVFDQAFNYVTDKPFSDPSIPAGFAPFNIQNIGGKLYVTYAKQLPPDNHDDEAAPGNGYVNIFNPDGTLWKRFASQGTLNSPWGIVQAPDGFGQVSGAILVGNFGDGHINVYNSNGDYQGQLMNGSTVITVEGLWALYFPQNGIPAGDQNQLFFTAGPGGEAHGMFGYLSKL